MCARTESPVTERAGPSTRERGGPQAGHGPLQIELDRDPQAPATARAAVNRWCPALAGGAPRRETLMLLVSELVTNAVLHSPGPNDAPIRVRASVEREAVRIAVTDPGDGFAPPPAGGRPGGRMTIGGYGLHVVDRAASRWGVDREGGTRVWFEL
jgi:anti-sigma regulatory factor (Ser/Thr protein kinase)